MIHLECDEMLSVVSMSVARSRISASHSHQTLGDVLNEILAGKLGLSELIDSLCIGGEAP